MNAGAHESDMGSVLASVTFVEGASGTLRTVHFESDRDAPSPASSLYTQFSYRASPWLRARERDRETKGPLAAPDVLLSATMVLSPSVTCVPRANLSSSLRRPS